MHDMGSVAIKRIGGLICSAFTDTAALTLVLIFMTGSIGLVLHLGRALFAVLFQKKAPVLMLIYRAVTFTGVLSHEFSHAFFAVITGARVRRIHIGQRGGETYIVPRGNRLCRLMQLSVSSAGPVMGGLLWVLLIIRFLFPLSASPIYRGFLLYLIFSILLHSDMSGQDIKVWIHGFPGFFFFLFTLRLLFNALTTYAPTI